MNTSKTVKNLKESKLFSQKYKASTISFTPTCIIYTFSIFTIISLIAGIIITCTNINTFEKTIIYDGKGYDQSECHINKNNQKKTCSISFTIDQDIKKPLYIYYELDHFYQNHRQYIESRCSDQLIGKIVPDEKQQKECKVKFMNNDNSKILYPCGLIANSLFNDIYTLHNSSFELIEKDISRPIERELYHNPSHYGNDTHYQWIYETYSNIHKNKSNDIKSSAYYGGGVEDEHFIVWMSIASTPHFRKMYGRIEQNIPKQTNLTFTIENNFEVSSFEGTKAIVISTQNIYTHFTQNMAIIYYIFSLLCFIIVIYFLVMNYFYPQDLLTPLTKFE